MKKKRITGVKDNRYYIHIIDCFNRCFFNLVCHKILASNQWQTESKRSPEYSYSYQRQMGYSQYIC